MNGVLDVPGRDLLYLAGFLIAILRLKRDSESGHQYSQASIAAMPVVAGDVEPGRVSSVAQAHQSSSHSAVSPGVAAPAGSSRKLLAIGAAVLLVGAAIFAFRHFGFLRRGQFVNR